MQEKLEHVETEKEAKTKAAAEAKTVEKLRADGEAKAAEEAKAAAEAKAIEERQMAGKAKAAEEAKAAEKAVDEVKAAKEARAVAETKAAEERKAAGEAKAAEEAKAAAEAQAAEKRKAAGEAKAKAAEEAKTKAVAKVKVAEERKTVEEAPPLTRCETEQELFAHKFEEPDGCFISACKQHEVLHQISDGEESAEVRYVSNQGDFGKGKFSRGKFCKGMLNKVKFPAVLFIYAPEGNAAQQGCSGKYVVTSETGPDGNPTWKHSEDAELLLVRSDRRWCIGNTARWEDGPIINSSQGPEDPEISSTWVRRHDDVGLEHTAVYITSHADKIPKLSSTV